MTEPALLFCVGATKAGTSWLYKYLHDHPDCALPAVKEAHYWDTFDAEACAQQVARFRQRLRELRTRKEEARGAGRGWQVSNLNRRIDEMKKLIGVLEGDRSDDRAYLDWLVGGVTQTKLYADITPNYATLDDTLLARMVGISAQTRVLFLIRDPLDRLWSHIRMQARRQRQAHEVYEKKANNILYRMLNRGQETHILERGDYPSIIRKLRRVVPRDRLFITFTEEVMGHNGVSPLAAFLGIDPATPKVGAPVHKGPEVVMLDKLRPRAVKLLSEHYDWVSRNVGPLPDRWQENRARMAV